MDVLAISGSLRESSYNAALLRALAQRAPDGVRVRVLDATQLKALPLYDPADDTDAPPAAVAALRTAIASADALAIATPEYNGSMSGALKNAIDWASRPRGAAVLAGKPVLVMSASTGQYGGAWAQEDLARVLGVAGARVVGPRVTAPRARDIVDGDGRIHARHVLAQVDAACAALGELAGRSAAPAAGPSLARAAGSGGGRG